MKLVDTQSILGEGLAFLSCRNQVVAFDILARKAFLLDPDKDWALTMIDLPFHGSCAMELSDGAVLIAADHALYRTKDFTRFDLVISHEFQTDIRMNDGQMDPLGRFWYSSMAMNGDRPVGSIFCFDPSTSQTYEVFSDLTIPNAITFDAVRRRGYCADSALGLVWVFDYEQDQPDRSVFLDFSGQPFVPDGAVVDAEGRFWNAQWGGGCIAIFTPNGQKTGHFDLPVSQPSCPLLVGENLLVTSARLGLSEERLSQEPNAGCIFVIPQRDIVFFGE